MTAQYFYSKWNINRCGVSFYKKKFPEFVFDNKLNYTKLDKEFQRRIDIKEKAKDLLSEATVQDIEDCFSGENKYNLAHQWLKRLYMSFDNTNRNRQLISDCTLEQIDKITKHYIKLKNIN